MVVLASSIGMSAETTTTSKYTGAENASSLAAPAALDLFTQYKLKARVPSAIEHPAVVAEKFNDDDEAFFAKLLVEEGQS